MTKMDEQEITDYPGKDNPAVQAAIKDGTWRTKLDKSTNKVFFYNPTTKETTWDLVKTLAKAGTTTTTAAAGAATAANITTTQAADGSATGGKKVFGKKADAKPEEQQSAGAAANTAQPAQQASSQPAQAAVQQQPQAQTQAQVPQQQMQAAAAVPAATPYQTVQLSDPIQRLLDHNKKLVSDIATHEAQSITSGLSAFETRLDLLVHANNVLAVQLDRRNQEALALQRALTEAHDTIHKLRTENKNLEDQRSLSFARTNSQNVSNEDAKRSVATALETVGRTVVHLQEQNRSLSATIAQMTSQLVQNVQASAASRGVESVSDQPHEWWKNSKGYSVAALTSRFLDSPARNALCPKCTMRISDFRDSLLREVPMTEAQREAQERRDKDEAERDRYAHIATGGGGGSPAAVGPAGSSGFGSSPVPLRTVNAPALVARPQPQYVPVNAFRPAGGATTNTGGGGGPGNRGSPPAAGFSTPAGGATTGPRLAAGGGGVGGGHSFLSSGRYQ